MDCDKSVDGKTANHRTGGAFIPGETIVKLIKLYYWKRIDGYVTIPGNSLFKVAANGYTLEPVG